jgi:hypothetical protein
MTTSRNVIDVFARGNQELFHSAFLAWLMKDDESHGLGKAFRSRIISRLPETLGYDANAEYEVDTEYVSGRSRFDIILRPKDTAAKQKKGVVFENKTKSFGYHVQLEGYKKAEHDVAVLALLPETLDDETKRDYPVITYDVIRNVLNDISLRPENPYQFLVGQYRDFLEKTLGGYSAIADYCRGSITSDAFYSRLERAVEGVKFGDNDIRTFDYFYYHMLAEFINKSAHELAFGSSGYSDAEKQKVNTRWHFEKNMQGSPFMEAIIYRPFDTPGWTLHPVLRDVQGNGLQIAPRLEICLDPISLLKKHDINQKVGSLMLGTWSSEFKMKVRELDHYRSLLKPKRRSDRNFHCEDVLLCDLPFSQMTRRIREMMQLIFNHDPTCGRAGPDRALRLRV